MELIKDTTKTDDYYECPRCKNNTFKTGGTMIPCPRGSCEARIAGTTITKKTVHLCTNLSDEQIEWNTKNHR